MSSDQSSQPVVQRLKEDWPMYLFATAPVGGFTVAVGSGAFVIENKMKGKHSKETEGNALQMALYGTLTTVIWLVTVLVIA